MELIKCIPLNDGQFLCLFQELNEYVQSKLKLNGSGDIVDRYVVVRQEP